MSSASSSRLNGGRLIGPKKQRDMRFLSQGIFPSVTEDGKGARDEGGEIETISGRDARHPDTRGATVKERKAFQQAGVGDEGVLDRLGEAAAHLARGQGGERIDIRQHERRRVERADEILRLRDSRSGYEKRNAVHRGGKRISL